MKMKKVILAIDQGTTSTRCAAYAVDDAGRALERVVLSKKEEHEQIRPREGWLEHDAEEIFSRVVTCVNDTARALHSNRSGAGDESTAPNARTDDAQEYEIVGVGITNQRETIVVWDERTGRPIANAIVWSDGRAQESIESVQEETDIAATMRRCTGLTLSAYFSAAKIKWMVDHDVGSINEVCRANACRIGTIDSWIIWKLTSGTVHATDCTNASRTMLMDLDTLTWSEEACRIFRVPIDALPEIRSSAESFGVINASAVDFIVRGATIGGVLGDQHAATLGQFCAAGECKSTYGTGCFMMLNTGAMRIDSQHGLLTTLAWKLGRNADAEYALEGAVAVAGSGIVWLRDAMQLFDHVSEVEPLASSVPDSGGVIIVPALSGGLLAPYWRSDAKQCILGMTATTNKRHVVRAMLDAIALQIRDVHVAMRHDCEADAAHRESSVTTAAASSEEENVSVQRRLEPGAMRVDGGVSANNLMMQIQADALGVEVHRPEDVETTVRGAAMAAAIGVGVATKDALFAKHREGSVDGDGDGQRAFTPSMDAETREALYSQWKRAVPHSFSL